LAAFRICGSWLPEERFESREKLRVFRLDVGVGVGLDGCDVSTSSLILGLEDHLDELRLFWGWDWWVGSQEWLVDWVSYAVESIDGRATFDGHV
jgi:hypothetical protein